MLDRLREQGWVLNDEHPMQSLGPDNSGRAIATLALDGCVICVSYMRQEKCSYGADGILAAEEWEAKIVPETTLRFCAAVASGFL